MIFFKPAKELKYCMLYYEVFKANFEVLDIFGGFFWKN
jgi:hypothetical protein